MIILSFGHYFIPFFSCILGFSASCSNARVLRRWPSSAFSGIFHIFVALHLPFPSKWQFYVAADRDCKSLAYIENSQGLCCVSLHSFLLNFIFLLSTLILTSTVSFFLIRIISCYAWNTVLEVLIWFICLHSMNLPVSHANCTASYRNPVSPVCKIWS